MRLRTTEQVAASPLEAARKLLQSQRAVGRYGGGAFKLADSKLPDGTPVVLGQNAAGDWEMVSADQYYRALVWDAIGAHPPTLSNGYYGHWKYPPEM